MACYARGTLPHLTTYGLACKESSTWRFDASETIVYDVNQEPRERYEDTIQQSLNAALDINRSILLSDVKLKVNLYCIEHNRIFLICYAKSRDKSDPKTHG